MNTVETVTKTTKKEVAKGGKKVSKAAKRGAKKTKRIITSGIAHILASFNNTIVTITDNHGQVIAQKSSAGCGFRGSRKSTPHAAGQAAEEAARAAVENCNMKEVQVRVKGPGQGREAAIRQLTAGGLKVIQITDCTPIPHNGVKNPKKRRV